MRGWWISLEGVDGSGKTELTKSLVEACERINRPYVTCVEPGGTPLGVSLRQLLLQGREDSMCGQSELLLFMASRAELMYKVVRPALNAGKVVLTDRSVLSTIVYQGYAAGLDKDSINVVRGIGNYATGGLFADLTIVLDCSVDISMARRAAGRATPPDRIESRGVEYMQRVRSGYRAEASTHPSTLMIGANKSLSHMRENVVALFYDWLKNAERPIQQQ